MAEKTDVNAKWDACLDLSVRRFVYSSLAGAFGGLLLFSQSLSFPVIHLNFLILLFRLWIIMACGSGLSSFLFSAVIWYCHPNYFVLSQGFVANLQVSMFTLA